MNYYIHSKKLENDYTCTRCSRSTVVSQLNLIMGVAIATLAAWHQCAVVDHCTKFLNLRNYELQSPEFTGILILLQ